MAHHIAQRAVAAGDQVAISDEHRSYRWREVNDILNRAVHGLRMLAGDGRRIAVVGANSAETTLVHLAGLLAGVSTVPVNPRLTAAELAYILEDSGAAAVFLGPEARTTGEEAATKADVAVVIGWRSPGSGHDWDDWLAAQRSTEPPVHVPPASALFYTSGTTGLPKGTFSRPLALPDVEAFVAEIVATADESLGPSRRPVLVVGPLHHIGPLSSSMVGLLAGDGVVILPSFDARAVLEAIERYRIGSMVAVPTHFVRLLALPPEVRNRYDVSSLECVGHTGAGCPVPVKRAMIEWWGPILVEAYGATESGIVTRIEAAEWLDHPGSVGRCIAEFTPVVVDDDDRALPTGEVGRLYFRDGTHQGIEYHNAPEKTAASHLEPGVFTLGDVGYVDADGYVFITDRATDMIVSGGVNVYPGEAERVLIEHPGVRDAAVIGVPHDDLGETPLALVEPADSSSTAPSSQELMQWCRERLAHYKCPTSFELVSHIPRSAMGKLDKRALRAPYWPTERTIGG